MNMENRMKSFLMRLVTCAVAGFAAFAAEAAVSVRLLFVYDAGAQDYLSQNSLDAYSVASSCVSQMNNVLANSRLTGTDNLTQQSNDYFSYTLAGVTTVQARNSKTATAWSQAYNVVLGNTAESDVSMDGLLEDRAYYAADIIVMLIYRSGGADGNSTPYQGTDAEYAVNFAGKAVSVVDVEMAVAEGSGAFGAFQICSHEVAHTLGCGHADTQDTQSGQQSSSYSFGYQFDYPGDQNYTLYQNNSYQAWWGCTVMAYKEHFFKNPDGTFMSAEDVLALTGWTDADDREHLWNNFDGSYGTTYAKGIWNYCNMLPYFSSPDLCFVTMNSSAATVVPTSWATAHYDAGTYVPMGDATHNNRQVLIDNCGYASRWHLGVKFTKAGDASVVNGKADKITLSSLSDNCSVYYTTDGTEPTKTNGTLYSAPISLTQTTTIKARSYDANDNAGDVFTREYSVLPLAAALGNTELAWTTSSPAWYVDSGVARSGVINSDGVTSTLSTVITGPATLSFEYRTELMDSDVFNVTVGSESVLTATDYNSDWRSSGEISIPEGDQTVTFSFTVNFYMGMNNAAVRNVSVVYAYDPSEEPDDPTPAEPTYDGPTPTAVWVSGEFEDEATLHGGYKIERNDNTVNDSGNIVIGSATTLGAVIDLSDANCTNASLLVWYSLPSNGAPVANAVPLSMYDTKDMGGVATSAGSPNVTGYYLNGSTVTAQSNYGFSDPAPTLQTEGYMLLEVWAINVNHSSHGTAFYSGTSIDNLSGGINTTLRFAGANNRVTKAGIGGPTQAGAKPWAGMEIKGVALFANEWVDPEDLALYEFPEAAEQIPEGAVASVVYNGEVVYHNTVMAALTAVYMGQSDTPVVKVYDGSTTDYSGLGFTYDAATQTYTMVTAVAKIQTGIIESEFATLAEACETAQEEGVSVVILLKAFAEIGESIPAGWVYVTPAESNTDYGTLSLAVNEIPNTVCKMPLTQENVYLSSDGEWAVVGASPIYVTLGTATNSFTLSFDADIPEGFGTLFSWDSALNSTTVDSRVVITNDASKQVIWRKGDGSLSDVAYTTSELIPSGEHYIELSWVHNEGATIKVDGEPYYASGSLKFTDYLTSRLAFGGSALGSPDDVLAGLKVKNLNLRFGKTPTEPDEEEAGYPVLNYITRLDGTVYHGNDVNRAVITNWQSQLIHPATRPVPADKTDAEFDTIDVLFVYDTPGKASVEAGDTEEWNGFSKLEVFSAKATARMNQILCTTDMDTNFWFRMVGVHCVDGTGGTIAEILGKGEGLRDEYSGLLDLRDRYGADVIVTPTTQSGGYGGLARLNTLDEITSRHQNAAYHIASVLLGYSQTHAWVHEIGHNMSLNHYPPANFDPANTWRGLGIQHKIAVDGTSMSTVMAEQGYADFCGGFSSKNHIYHGSMLSLSNHLDSTGVLLEAAPYVSQWRSTRIPEKRSVKCLPENASTLVGDTEFTLSYPDPDAEIYYQAWGLNDNEFVKYNGPFTIPATTGYAYITAYAVTNGVATAQELVNYSTFGDTYKNVLGSGSLPWSIVSSIDGNWTPSNGGYYEINDNFTGKSNSVCVLSTSLNGPDTLTFEHSELLKDNPYWHDTYPHSYPNSSFVVWVDNEPAYALRDATNTLDGWVSTDIAIPEGTHKVEFVYTHRSGYVSGETVRIKSVALASAQEPLEHTVYYKSGSFGGDDALVFTLADGSTPATLTEGGTVIIDDKTNNDVVFGSTLPANVGAIRVARDVTFTAGAATAFDGLSLTIDSGATLTIGGNVALGTATVDGAGTLAFVAFPAKPTLASTWTGTVELPAFRAGGETLTDYCINGTSTLKLHGITGGYLMWNNLDFQSELILDGDFVLTDMSAREFRFAKISGAGNISLSPGTYELTSFTIGELAEGYVGVVSNNMRSSAITIQRLSLPTGASIAPGTKILATGGTCTINLNEVYVGGVKATVTYARRMDGADGDGFYVTSVVTADGSTVTVATDGTVSSVAVPLPDGFAGKIVVPASVSTLSVSGANVQSSQLVLETAYGSTLARYENILLFGNGGAVSLDPDGVVGDVAVRPELDLSIATPYDATKEKVFIKAIPGLWYSVIYGDALVGGGIGGATGETEPVQATGVTLTLDAPKDGAKRFYRVKVAPVAE